VNPPAAGVPSPRAPGATIWFTGLPGAGKTTLAVRVAEALRATGHAAAGLDGDALRTGLNADLGFSPEDRVENVRRVGEVARLFALAGLVVLVSLISPFERERELVRRRHDESGLPFVLVHVCTSLQVCEERDPKGLYARARRGEIDDFTGVSDPYERPASAELVVDTEGRTPDESTAEILAALESMRVLRPA
jgi:bifunctional enzyme CysN/CysC